MGSDARDWGEGVGFSHVGACLISCFRTCSVKALNMISEYMDHTGAQKVLNGLQKTNLVSYEIANTNAQIESRLVCF